MKNLIITTDIDTSNNTGYIYKELLDSCGPSTYAIDLSDKVNISSAQNSIRTTENIIFVFPIHWGSYPWRLKKFFDEVLSYGFAYKIDHLGNPVGLLNNKRVFFVSTMGHPNEYYKQQADSIKYLFDKTIIAFCGMTLIDNIFIGGRSHGDISKLDLSELKTKIKSFLNN